MEAGKQPVIALLGQPNSGKSTLFNQLTGLKQHVGNWPGKTVEKKEGFFTREGITYKIVDLPGSYSLSANSEEEIVTRDYIANGNADLVLILTDAAQLERSLYMLADFAGIRTPAVLLLNMMDVAEKLGKKIDAARIEKKLGIPVLPFVAAEKKQYEKLYRCIRKAIAQPELLDTKGLEKEYCAGGAYKNVLALMPEQGIAQYDPMWLAVKCLEQDQVVLEQVKADMSEKQKTQLQEWTDRRAENNTFVGNCKYHWIQGLLKDAVQESRDRRLLTKFDRLATSRFWGKLIAVGVILLALAASMVVASPLMAIGSMLPALLTEPLRNLLESIHAAEFLVSLVSSLIPNILYFAVSMSGFVLGITFVFSFIEEVGYMARISFVFDNWMSRLGLQGKSIMAFFMGAGCTIGGAAGTRVIDNWGQRILAMALVWAVPCGATWSLMPTLASMFFGKGAVLVMIAIVCFMFAFMAITAKIFGPRLAPAEERTGMIMEMPPYHKPRWGHLIRHTLNHAWDIFKRAVRVIFLVALVFWILSYTADGNIANSIIYKVGTFIEPVTRIFGLGWQTFMAFVASALSKEAVLGVLSSIYTNSGTVFDSTVGAAAASGNLGDVLPTVISKAEALAFIFATTFNVPCVMALATTYRESHSLKWTLRIAAYYTCMALLLSCIVYHIGLALF